MFRGWFSYVWGLGILTFEGNFSYVLRLGILTFGD